MYTAKYRVSRVHTKIQIQFVSSHKHSHLNGLKYRVMRSPTRMQSILTDAVTKKVVRLRTNTHLHRVFRAHTKIQLNTGW